MKRAITAVFLALALVFVSIGATACAKDELPVPTNILIDDYYRMTWDAVEGSRGYLVGITDTAGEYTEKTARRANYSLSTLAEGDYEIRIKALNAPGALAQRTGSKRVVKGKHRWRHLGHRALAHRTGVAA